MPFVSSSQYRGGPCDRRRRLLTDELSHGKKWPAFDAEADDNAEARMSHYGDAEFLGESLRLFDLVPRRATRLGLTALVGAALLVGLEFAYAWLLEHVAHGGRMYAMLDLSTRGSLGNWCCSLALTLAAVGAIVIYGVRRHRLDDYHGRYRVWLWAAACWFLLATDQASGLREAFRDVMFSLTGSRLWGDGNIWWASVYTLLLGAVGSRLVIDMRPNWPGIMTLGLAAVNGGLAAVLAMGWTLGVAERFQVMVRFGVEMGGSLCLLAAMVLHARHVLMDAEGLLPVWDDEVEDVDAEPEPTVYDNQRRLSGGNDTWVKIDAPHRTPQPVLRRAPAAPSPPPPVEPDLTVPTVQRKLTKGEKKALKARLMRERMKREGHT